MIIKIEDDTSSNGSRTRLKKVVCRHWQRDNIYGVWPSRSDSTARTVHDNCCHRFKETVVLHLLFLPNTLIDRNRKGLCECYVKRT